VKVEESCGDPKADQSLRARRVARDAIRFSASAATVQGRDPRGIAARACRSYRRATSSISPRPTWRRRSREHFKLLSSSGPMGGDERNPMLQRSTARVAHKDELDHISGGSRGEEPPRNSAGARSVRAARRSPRGLWLRTADGGARAGAVRGEALDARGYQEISTPILVTSVWESRGTGTLPGKHVHGRGRGQLFSLKPMNSRSPRWSTATRCARTATSAGASPTWALHANERPAP